MTTTDSNGIVFLEATDNISPFHTTINLLQQGTSDAFDGVGAANYVICTSTTRPAHLFGLRIAETDTGITYISINDVWRRVGYYQAPATATARASEATFSPLVWSDASLPFHYPFQAGAQYLLNGVFNGYIGGAAAHIRLRLLAAGLVVSTEYRHYMPAPNADCIASISNIFVPATTASVATSLQVYPESPATGVVSRVQTTLQISRVG